MKKIIYTFLLFLIPVFLFSQTGEWMKLAGPIGGLGYNIKIHPQNKNIMYINDGFAGVYKSVDGGGNWEEKNNGIDATFGFAGDSRPVYSLALDASSPDTVWIGTSQSGLIYRSVDGGDNWELKSNGLESSIFLTVRNIVIPNNQTDVLYASCELSVEQWGTNFDQVKGQLYKSVDYGETWTKIWEGNSLARWVCVNHNNPDIIIVATGIFDREAINVTGEGVIKSVDGGSTWTNNNQGNNHSLFIGAMANHHDVPNRTIVGSGNYTETDAGMSGAVYITEDFGDSWTMVLAPQQPGVPSSPDNTFTAAAFAPSNPDIAYIANAENFYKSSDAGYTWTLCGDGSGGGNSTAGIRAGVPIEIKIDSDNPNIVFVTNYGGGVFKSTDAADIWEVLGTGYSGAILRTISVSSQDESKIATTGRSGPFKSNNAGENWTGLYYGDVIGNVEWSGISIDPNDTNKMFLTDEGEGKIFRTTDGGSDWQLVFDQETNGEQHAIRKLKVAPSNSDIIYAGYCDAQYYNMPDDLNYNSSFGIFRSNDGGGFWEPIYNGLSLDDLNVLDISIDPNNENIVYIAMRGDGVYKTTNGGNLWTDITNNLPTDNVFSLAVSPLDNNTVFVGTRENGVFKSTDGGASWTQVLDGLIPASAEGDFKTISAIVIDPENTDVVYASDIRTGVYRTEDGGATWDLFNDNLDNRAVVDLAISDNGNSIYAATNGAGVFRYSHTTIVSNSNIIENKLFAKIYPNPSKNEFQLEFNLKEPSEIQVEIFNVIGQKILQENYNQLNSGKQQLTIPIKHLITGIYFVKIYLGNDEFEVLEIEVVN